MIRRVGSEALSNLLPTVALLGHFDLKMLKDICGVKRPEFESLFDDLRHQEWIIQRTAPIGDGSENRLVLKRGSRGIRDRLLAYFRERGSGLGHFRLGTRTPTTWNRPLSTTTWARSVGRRSTPRSACWSKKPTPSESLDGGRVPKGEC